MTRRPVLSGLAGLVFGLLAGVLPLHAATAQPAGTDCAYTLNLTAQPPDWLQAHQTDTDWPSNLKLLILEPLVEPDNFKLRFHADDVTRLALQGVGIPTENVCLVRVGEESRLSDLSSLLKSRAQTSTELLNAFIDELSVNLVSQTTRQLQQRLDADLAREYRVYNGSFGSNIVLILEHVDSILRQNRSLSELLTGSDSPDR